jgi:hypothetical protein
MIKKKKIQPKLKKIKKTKEQEETEIQQIVNHFFMSKGLSLDEIKKDSKKRKIIYSRYTRPAKQLLALAGSVKKAQQAITIVADWANSRKLDYAIETVFKKWLELDRLKPKEVVKKPFYRNQLLVWSKTKKKWYLVNDSGDWLEFVGDESKIDWRIVD